jgi:hypothetical protein
MLAKGWMGIDVGQNRQEKLCRCSRTKGSTMVRVAHPRLRSRGEFASGVSSPLIVDIDAGPETDRDDRASIVVVEPCVKVT